MNNQRAAIFLKVLFELEPMFLCAFRLLSMDFFSLRFFSFANDETRKIIEISTNGMVSFLL